MENKGVPRKGMGFVFFFFLEAFELGGGHGLDKMGQDEPLVCLELYGDTTSRQGSDR